MSVHGQITTSAKGSSLPRRTCGPQPHLTTGADSNGSCTMTFPRSPVTGPRHPRAGRCLHRPGGPQRRSRLRRLGLPRDPLAAGAGDLSPDRDRRDQSPHVHLGRLDGISAHPLPPGHLGHQRRRTDHLMTPEGAQSRRPTSPPSPSPLVQRHTSDLHRSRSASVRGREARCSREVTMYPTV